MLTDAQRHSLVNVLTNSSQDIARITFGIDFEHDRSIHIGLRTEDGSRRRIKIDQNGVITENQDVVVDLFEGN